MSNQSSNCESNRKHEVVRRIKELTQELRILSLQLDKTEEDQSEKKSSKTNCKRAETAIDVARKADSNKTERKNLRLNTVTRRPVVIPHAIKTASGTGNEAGCVNDRKSDAPVNSTIGIKEDETALLKEGDRVVITNHYKGLLGSKGRIVSVTAKTVNVLLDNRKGKIVNKFKKSVRKI